MKVENQKKVAVDYTLVVDGKIADQSKPGQPLVFICGTGMLLPKFEEAIMGKEPQQEVSFTLEAKDGYGEVNPQMIIDLPRNIFAELEKNDSSMFVVGASIPMATADGQHVVGRILSIESENVKMDFNHPMAGKTLNFTVKVISVEDATEEELSGRGCCGSCTGQDGDCGGCNGGSACGGCH
ncbi:MAG: peptidylprolyl isomerase [Alistipes sp.]|nr:peptidylprolyl isomerase [Candidatus Alistipes equi]